MKRSSAQQQHPASLTWGALLNKRSQTMERVETAMAMGVIFIRLTANELKNNIHLRTTWNAMLAECTSRITHTDIISGCYQILIGGINPCVYKAATEGRGVGAATHVVLLASHHRQPGTPSRRLVLQSLCSRWRTEACVTFWESQNSRFWGLTVYHNFSPHTAPANKNASSFNVWKWWTFHKYPTSPKQLDHKTRNLLQQSTWTFYHLKCLLDHPTASHFSFFMTFPCKSQASRWKKKKKGN